MRLPVAVALISSLSSLLALGCQSSKREAQTGPTQVAESDGVEDGDGDSPSTVRPLLEAAGLSLTLPGTWAVAPSEDPNFAMAMGPAPTGTQTFGCVIELRRQGRGELSRAAKPTKTSTPTDMRYNQGPLHGRLREFPGPHAGAVVLVHCRGPRSNSDWGPIDEGLDKVRSSGPPALTAKIDPPAPESIVEMCVGTPSRKTHVCARRQDGGVYCGMSAETELARVELPSATQIGCDGVYGCSRDAEGQVSCWKAGEAPAPAPALGKVRDLAGGCVVSEKGAVSCRARREDGMTLDSFAELKPLDDAAHVLSDVSQVLAGSNANTGCVIVGKQLRCWDALDSLRLTQEGLDVAPQLIAEVGDGIEDLIHLTGKLCTVSGGMLTCYGAEASTSLPACTTHSCGCDLVATSLLSCEHEPHARLDSQTYGHISGVTAVAGACAGLDDGRVACRGPAPGERSDSEEIQALVTGRVPGILHTLRVAAP